MRRRVYLWVFSLLTAGCFSDITGTETTLVGHTDGEPCPQGESGCECYGNGTCDAGLSCAVPAAVCVPSGCEPGSKACVCDDDEACEGALICVGSVCRAEAPGTTSGGPTSASTAQPDDDDGSSSADDTTSGSGESSTTAQDGSSSEASGGSSCVALDCGPCTECVAEPGEACGEAFGACEDELGCLTAAECMRSCGVDGLCLGNCCDGLSENAANAARALNVCRSDQCAAACGDYPDAQCS